MENLVSQQNLGAFYKKKKVFVTGHTGFKGSWLIAWLKLLGAEVKGYALAPEYPEGLFNVVYPGIEIEHVEADIRAIKALKAEILDFQPDYIFHLAAQPLVRRSYIIPTETFEVNVIGTANLLESVISLEKKCAIIIITTDKVYENKEQDILYKETDELGGYDPYSASKAGTEIVVSSFRNSFFNISEIQSHQKAVVSVRAGNVIGGGDYSEDRIIPDIVRALRNTQAIKVRNPKSVRPWQHVLEPLSGYLLLGGMLYYNPQKYSGAFNFGPAPQDHLTVKEIVELAIKVWGKGTWEDISNTFQVHEANLLKLDINKSIKYLQWEPKLNAEQAIEWTIGWYKQKVEDLRMYTEEQIKAYMKL